MNTEEEREESVIGSTAEAGKRFQDFKVSSFNGAKGGKIQQLRATTSCGLRTFISGPSTEKSRSTSTAGAESLYMPLICRVFIDHSIPSIHVS